MAGEASGDLHAANLVKALKDINTPAVFFGLGGKKLKEQGVQLYCDIVELAVVGLFEVLKNLSKFRAVFNGLLKEIDCRRPCLAILVDYPDFNLRLAAELKKRNIPVVYYISPQVWAWRRGRIKTIRALVDIMIVFFKFEEELYRKERVPVAFVGHPLLDTVRPKLGPPELFQRFNIPPSKFTVGLLPGSREKEVKNILPVMLQAAKLLHERLKDVKFLILRSPTVKEEIFSNITEGCTAPLFTLTDLTYEGINASDFCMVASGTATLETAIIGKPMAILYKVSLLTYWALKMFIRVPYIGMVNIIAGNGIVPEFIQFNARPEIIASHIEFVLTNASESDKIEALLQTVKERLGKTQANTKAAQVITEMLKKC